MSRTKQKQQIKNIFPEMGTPYLRVSFSFQNEKTVMYYGVFIWAGSTPNPPPQLIGPLTANAALI